MKGVATINGSQCMCIGYMTQAGFAKLIEGMMVARRPH